VLWLLELLQDVPKGQQVFINLGQKTNFVLLNTYGFSDPDNHHDSLSVRLQLDEADPFLAAKERMLQRFGLKNDASATVTRLADTVTVPLDLLAFMRVKVRARSPHTPSTSLDALLPWSSSSQLGDVYPGDALSIPSVCVVGGLSFSISLSRCLCKYGDASDHSFAAVSLNGGHPSVCQSAEPSLSRRQTN